MRYLIVFLPVFFCLTFSAVITCHGQDIACSFTDVTGTNIGPGACPKRIISINPSLTEIICALDREQYLIGVTRFCPFSRLITRTNNIGTLLTPDIERIIELKPDIVFASISGNRKDTVELLRRAGIRVYVFDRVRDFKGLFDRIQTLGAIIKCEDRALELNNELGRRLSAVRRKAAAGGNKQKIFIQLNRDPIITANRNTIINEMVEMAGGINIAGDSTISYPQYSRESVIHADPDIIIGTTMYGNRYDIIAEWRGYGNISAVKTNSIYMIDSSIICNVGPRLIKGVEEIADHVEETKNKKAEKICL